MKIAILTSGILPVPAVKGGAVENLIDMYLEYNDREKSHDITIFSIRDKGTGGHPVLLSDVNHYEYIDMDSPWAKLRKWVYAKMHKKGYYHYSIEYFFQKAYRRMRKKHYDMILIENRPGFALKLPNDSGSKVVVHLHNDFLNAETPFGKNIYKRVDTIICVSEFIRGKVRSVYDDDNKCMTVLNGINLEAFRQPKVTVCREDYGLKTKDFILVFSGRVIPEKGIREVILAMNELKEHKDIKLLVVGGSFYGNEGRKSPFTKELIKLSWDVRSQIVFTGFRPYKEIPALLSIADVAILPSIWKEPLGLTCIEAMAMGLPIITTDKGGIPETVTSDCALILEVNETLPQRIANAILNLYKYPKKRKAMSEAALERIPYFSKERYAREFFEALEKV